jgi:hypothetical protein
MFLMAASVCIKEIYTSRFVLIAKYVQKDNRHHPRNEAEKRNPTINVTPYTGLKWEPPRN